MRTLNICQRLIYSKCYLIKNPAFWLKTNLDVVLREQNKPKLKMFCIAYN